jgi:PAS domain S-box-containing protein
VKELSNILQQTEQLVKAGLNHARVTVATQDLNFVYTAIYNPHENYRAENFVGKRMEDFFSATEAKHLRAVKKKVLATGQPHHRVIRAQVEGRERHYDATVHPLRNELGETVGLTTVSVDITDFVEAQKILADANARLVKLLDSALGT